MPNKSSLGRIDIDFLAQRTEFEARLRACLGIFGGWMSYTTYFIPKFYKCLGLMNHTSTQGHYNITALDAAPLSYKFRAKSDTLKKPAYLLATIHHIMYLWWKFKDKKFSARRMRHCIRYLEGIVDAGLDNCKIKGNLRKGWRLKYG